MILLLLKQSISMRTRGLIVPTKSRPKDLIRWISKHRNNNYLVHQQDNLDKLNKGSSLLNLKNKLSLLDQLFKNQPIKKTWPSSKIMLDLPWTQIQYWLNAKYAINPLLKIKLMSIFNWNFKTQDIRKSEKKSKINQRIPLLNKETWFGNIWLNSRERDQTYSIKPQFHPLLLQRWELFHHLLHLPLNEYYQ